MDRALAGLIVIGIAAGAFGAVFPLVWLFEHTAALTVRICRWLRAARASR
ncbi:hypothetical protein ABH930_000311 [Kitasatospora sp. GAS204A]|nr:hypothetical protein [Kitasatospora sp. GAS204B]